MTDTREEIIRDIQRVAHAIEPEPLTKKAYKRKGSISETKVRNHFGSWNEAVKAAGLKPNPRGISPSGRARLSDEDLFQEIGSVWQETGRRPTEALMNARGKLSIQPYRNRWKTFARAVDEYVRLYGKPAATLGALSDPSETRTIPPRDNSRQIVVLPTHKPKNVVNRQRILYGEPLEFRGLRYAPINEQGVVYMFGMVSKELGFLIESVRTDYPDCEGKRSLDSSGMKWQHVRIEFEYRSKNFVEHGHDPDECDLIVCWVHDWEECPMEVLELRSAIRLLPPK